MNLKRKFDLVCGFITLIVLFNPFLEKYYGLIPYIFKKLIFGDKN